MEKLFKTVLLFITILISQQSFAGIKPVISKKIILKENWKVQQNNKILSNGASISSASNNTANWYNASVPSTVMGVLTANGLYENIFIGENYKKIDKNYSVNLRHNI